MTTKQANTMLEVLAASGPAPEVTDDVNLYGWLVGAWDMEVRDFKDGAARVGRGECHFGWVLEGRAIQDVWIIPSLAERQAGVPSATGNRYGTTLRVYEPATRTWRITWINPVKGARNELVGRRVGAEIVQEGKTPEGAPMRWIFSDITPTSFRWRNEVSPDGGSTWRLETEFRVRRRG